MAGLGVHQFGLRVSLPHFITTSSSSSSARFLAVTSLHIHASYKLVVKGHGKKEQHLWKKRESANSGQKALNLVHIVTKLSNEKEVIYGVLDKWAAFEVEFPVIASAKALEILRKRRQWLRIIQVSKWLMSKGQVLTWTTYDSLIEAFDIEKRIDEAESIYSTIIATHTRSVPKRIFSRMIAMYDHHHLAQKILEIFGDMEELGVNPDENTTRRIGRAFSESGQEEKEKLVLEKYLKKWKYLHFKGERVRVQRTQYPNQ